MTGELGHQSMIAPPGASVALYTASKMLHAGKMLAIRDDYPAIYLTSRWPAFAGVSSEYNRPARHWLEDNKADIRRADVFLIYAEKDDDLKGALYEAGYADAFDKPIYVVGSNKDYSKWQFGKNMKRRSTLKIALDEIVASLRYDSPADFFAGAPEELEKIVAMNKKKKVSK